MDIPNGPGLALPDGPGWLCWMGWDGLAGWAGLVLLDGLGFFAGQAGLA